MTKDITPTDIENMDERTRDEYFMAIAMEEARKAYELGEIPIGAILVKDNTIVSRHHNRRELDHDATAHAEVLVIREACDVLKRWRLTGCTLYVTIEPCPMCGRSGNRRGGSNPSSSAILLNDNDRDTIDKPRYT